MLTCLGAVRALSEQAASERLGGVIRALLAMKFLSNFTLVRLALSASTIKMLVE